MRPNSSQSSLPPFLKSVNATVVPWIPNNPPPPRTNSRRFLRSVGSVNRLPTVLFRQTASELFEVFLFKDGRVAADDGGEGARLLAHFGKCVVRVFDGSVAGIVDVAVEDEDFSRCAGLCRGGCPGGVCRCGPLRLAGPRGGGVGLGRRLRSRGVRREKRGWLRRKRSSQDRVDSSWGLSFESEWVCWLNAQTFHGSRLARARREFASASPKKLFFDRIPLKGPAGPEGDTAEVRENRRAGADFDVGSGAAP